MESHSHLPKVIIIHKEQSHPAPLIDTLSKLQQTFNPESLIWMIDTKYYEAQVKFETIVHDDDERLDHRLESLERKEAFIYYFSSEGELDSAYSRMISNIQETCNPEIALLFYNGVATVFKRQVEETIDQVVQNHFIEYLREDLGAYRVPKNGAGSRPAGSLLGGDEKIGIERLIESQ